MLEKAKMSVFCHHLKDVKVCDGPCFPWQFIHSLRSAWPMLCLLPTDSLIWLRATLGTCYPGRTTGDQHRAKQMFRHSGQLAGHLCIIYLLTCLWWCAYDERHLGSWETWHGLRRQESVLATYPVRSEKRITYHRHSLAASTCHPSLRRCDYAGTNYLRRKQSTPGIF